MVKRTQWLDTLIKDLDNELQYYKRVKQIASNPEKLKAALKKVRDQRNLAILAIVQKDVVTKRVREALGVLHGITDETPQATMGNAIKEIRRILEGR